MTTYHKPGSAFGLFETPFSTDLNAADAVLLGAAFDLGTSGRAGTREGPQGVRNISDQLIWESHRWPWRFNLKEQLRLIDYGDIKCEPGMADEFVADLSFHVGKILDADKMLLTIGGDHFLTLPILRQMAKKHGPVAILHFDAHTDTEKVASEMYHGNMFYKGLEEGIINREASIQCGIRTEMNDPHPYKVLSANDLNDWSVDEIVKQIKAQVGDAPTYLTFDIDCLDPAYAPGTGTPVAGGITTNRALQILRKLTGIDIVGMDVMEVAPCYDSAEITSLAAATIAYDLLHVVAANRDPSLPRP